jgi:hypothetical protein
MPCRLDATEISRVALDRSVDIALEAHVQHRFRIRRAGPAVAVALLAAACAASDENNPSPLPVGAGTSPPASPASPPATAPEVSAEDAMAIALDAVGGGQVLETDDDEFEVVVQVWEVTVLAPDGVRRQVSIDMTNGSVMGNEADD